MPLTDPNRSIAPDDQNEWLDNCSVIRQGSLYHYKCSNPPQPSLEVEAQIVVVVVVVAVSPTSVL